MPHGTMLTQADKLAYRRICIRHRGTSRKVLCRMTGVSPATVVRMLRGIPEGEGLDGSYPILRALFAEESGDTTEHGWRVVWDRSQEIENVALSRCLVEVLSHEAA